MLNILGITKLFKSKGSIMKFVFISLLFSLLITSCNYQSNPIANSDPDTVSGNSDLKSEITWEKEIQPIFKNNCINCHKTFSDYEYVKTNFKSIFARIEDGSMPMGAKLADVDMDLIKKWQSGNFVQSPSAPSVKPIPEVIPEPTPEVTPTPEPEFSAQQVIDTQCASCHQTGMAGVPNIYGLPSEYLVAEMNHYNDGTRTDSAMYIMNSALKSFSNEEIQKIADTLSATKKCVANVQQETTSADIKRGATLFKFKCASCHAGTGTMTFPWIKGQDRKYLEKTMFEFISEQRPGSQMYAYLVRLSEEDIRNIAAFLNAEQTCNQQ